MSADNKAFVKRWFEEVWNKGRAEAIDEMFAPDGIAHGLSEDPKFPLHGPAAFKPYHKQLRDALSNIHIDIVDSISEGDKVVVRCVVTAIHSGASFGVAPTNKPVRFEGVTITRVKDGKIAEGWNYFDFMKLYTEIGLLKK